MIEYRFIYKCRLCGGINENTCTGAEGTAQRMLTMACIGNPTLVRKNWESLFLDTIDLFSTHVCKDGQMGITDLQGYRRVQTEEGITK